ncbi:hypothetical protein PF008_g11609 [Phytophthora fragariae]|nr:hypothetical protein PF008_g11609 [Phytophthora fragariae]
MGSDCRQSHSAATDGHRLMIDIRQETHFKVPKLCRPQCWKSTGPFVFFFYFSLRSVKCIESSGHGHEAIFNTEESSYKYLSPST